MQFIFSLLFVGTLIAPSVLAVPAPATNQVAKRSFKVERIANPHFVARDGTRQLIKSYSKYGMPLPAELIEARNNARKALVAAVSAVGNTTNALNSTSSAAKNTTAGAAGTGTGLVTATPETGDTEYLSPVKIGGQTINMDFDSGSADLWVFSTMLPAASQKGHTVYDSTKSTTFKAMTGAKFSISYGDGSGATGVVGTDTVDIGGAVVQNQAVELATAVSASFVEDTQSNGLVGLAFSKLNTVKPTQQKTFFDSAMPTLAQPVFTADLRASSVGAYEFGKIDTTKFNGSLSYAPVNTTNGFWQFSSEKFSVNGVAMTVPGGTAIADTGTTLMLANAAIVNAYYSKVQGATNNATVGGVTFPCNAVMPDLAVAVGADYMATVPGKFINFAKVDAAGTSKPHSPMIPDLYDRY